MIVYHGTTLEVSKPDVERSKRYLDFGKGFYLTTYRKLVEDLIENEPELFVYEVSQ